MSEPSTKKIRFGVFVDGEQLRSWQLACLQDLLDMEGVELALVIRSNTVSQYRLSDRLRRIKPSTLLFQLYKAVFVNPPALHLVSAANAFGAAPIMRCEVIQKRYSQYFTEADVEEIRSYKLDFTIRFGFGIIRGKILKSARYGVWSFHHDDHQRYRGGPPAFWEIYRNDPVTGSILQRLTNRLDSGTVIKRGFLKTNSSSYSRNLNAALIESAAWPAQVCVDIRNGAAEYLDADASSSAAPILRYPTNFTMLKCSAKLVRNKVVNTFGSLFRHAQWNVGIVDAPIQSFTDSGFKPEISWLPTPDRHTYRADPFVVESRGGKHILFESVDFKNPKGKIASIRIEDGDSLQRRVEIGPDVHMSYPFVIQVDGETYCLPETADANELALYKMSGEPTKWDRFSTILPNFKAADATIFRHEGNWWLMCTEVGNGSSHKLFIFHTASLTSSWTAHFNNPVKIDVRSARPGGSPFVHKGELFRPTQDSSRKYGGRIIINRIIKLTPYEFEEEQFAVIDPDASGEYPDGIHTVASAGDLTVVDGMRYVFDSVEFLQVLRRGALAAWNLLSKKLTSTERQYLAPDLVSDDSTADERN